MIKILDIIFLLVIKNQKMKYYKNIMNNKKFNQIKIDVKIQKWKKIIKIYQIIFIIDKVN